jgi:hypothetical protein
MWKWVKQMLGAPSPKLPECSLSIQRADLVQHSLLRVRGYCPVEIDPDGSYLVDYFGLAMVWKEINRQMGGKKRGFWSFPSPPRPRRMSCEGERPARTN